MTDHDDNRCSRCGRALYHPLAQAAGYGATCALRALGDRPRRKHPVHDDQLTIDDLKETA